MGAIFGKYQDNSLLHHEWRRKNSYFSQILNWFAAENKDEGGVLSIQWTNYTLHCNLAYIPVLLTGHYASVENSANLNHCPSAGRVTFITCPTCQKVTRPHTDFTLKSWQFMKSYPSCRMGWVSYLPSHIIFYPASGGWTGSIFNSVMGCMKYCGAICKCWTIHVYVHCSL